ncbi:hypothetical protein PGT21_019041 [Puccinia graminis f. sp. tritici]|uniref:Uncharacterized protein n=2 Tax=Puccinia graminis f. sp. tritici TaxID=56615 RepID=E3K158_PUCGT|nr:uncharacterized protein PGTG_03989 [Puccinia graminis f. sp. tritici CRL 75-36-700-3]KAA1096498.1 hypothetical protein PGT21_018554 [Puccinia graminis f. sp. tritici]EFP78033.1 hypothetical protein PGTG_03989 [Puccinia graminis f. sp. tritici CRL 75-36-700-3]KAA1113029.1 hypothetical protein PGT21_019041 [Puccinia graminis f. sp. tritici]KAA1131938.1 hypothetical protein PGTUg99_034144 [Puccinia graminis f. sp. tritici]KAA1135855.1 hypothetical protein PGTUg99_030012 [Puccinia graminis f. s
MYFARAYIAYAFVLFASLQLTLSSRILNPRIDEPSSKLVGNPHIPRRVNPVALAEPGKRSLSTRYDRFLKRTTSASHSLHVSRGYAKLSTKKSSGPTIRANKWNEKRNESTADSHYGKNL